MKNRADLGCFTLLTLLVALPAGLAWLFNLWTVWDAYDPRSARALMLMLALCLCGGIALWWKDSWKRSCNPDRRIGGWAHGSAAKLLVAGICETVLGIPLSWHVPNLLSMRLPGGQMPLFLAFVVSATIFFFWFFAVLCG